MADSNDTSPNRLLVVDSDVGEARRTATRCRQLGFEVLTANRCDDALEVYLKRLPQAVLVEMVFPDGTGLELIREIRTYDWSHTTVILLHTVVRGALEVVEGDARRAGANAVVPKPLSTRALASHVDLPANASAEPDDRDVPPPTDWDAKPIILGNAHPDKRPVTRAAWEGPTALNIRPLEPLEERESTAQRIADTQLQAQEPDDRDRSGVSEWEARPTRNRTVAYPEGFSPQGSHESDPLHADEALGDEPDDSYDWPEPISAEPAPRENVPDDLDDLSGLELPYPAITNDDVLLGLSGPRLADRDDDPLALLDREEDIGTLGGLLGLTSDGDISGLGGVVATDAESRPMGASQRVPPPVQARQGVVGADVAEVVREGSLAEGALLDILAAVARERWFGRVRIESGRLWTEMAFSEGYLWTVACDSQGASLVDVGYRHGLLPASKLQTLRETLDSGSERRAESLLIAHGLSVQALERLFALTATERITDACEFRDGRYRCAAGAPPDASTFEPRLPVDGLVATALDRHYPVMRAVDRYANRESQRIRVSERFESFPRDALGDDFSRAALESLTDGETVLDWLRRNPANPGALFLLLTKLELLGAVEVGDDGAPERFSFRGPESGFEGVGTQSRTMPATPSELATRDEIAAAVAAASDEVEVDEVASSRNGQRAAAVEKPSAPIEEASVGGDDGVDDDEEPMARWQPDDPEALWRKSLYIALDRWDWRQASSALEGRLNDEPDDVEAGSYESWLAFARALEDDGIGDPGDAIAELEHFRETSPSCPVPLFLLGLAALSLGNVRQAREHVEHALAIAPDDGAFTAASLLVRAGYYSHPAADLAASSVWRTIRNALK